MKKETVILVNYRFKRAHESLEEAKILLEQGYANTFVNRLYYACFYAVSALLLTKGFFSARHSGIRSFFHQNFVKTNLTNQELGQLYDKLFDNRQKGDYVDFVSFKIKEVYPWLGAAKHFVEVVGKLIRKEIGEM